MAGLVCGLIKTRTRMGWGYDMTQSHNKLAVISTITKNYLETSVGAFYLLKPRAWCGVASHDWREGEERRAVVRVWWRKSWRGAGGGSAASAEILVTSGGAGEHTEH